jgi:hypothetical protein
MSIDSQPGRLNGGGVPPLQANDDGDLTSYQIQQLSAPEGRPASADGCASQRLREGACNRTRG